VQQTLYRGVCGLLTIDAHPNVDVCGFSEVGKVQIGVFSVLL